MPQSAYSGAITIGIDSSPRQLALAARALAGSGGVVLLRGVLALKSDANSLSCDVIDPSPGAHRCAEEFKVLLENASRMLTASPLASLLPAVPRTWRVVEDNGSEVRELWR